MPEQINLGDWAQIAPLFDKLESRAAESKTAADLEQWVNDWSELSAALDEESSKRYIGDDVSHGQRPGAEKAYLHFVEKIEPQLKPRQFALEKIYVARRDEFREPSTSSNGRYFVFDRDIKNHIELFRPESVPLETEEAKLSQQYQKLSGSLTVIFRGQERTLVQMGRYLEETDRALRKEAWELVANHAALQEAEKFEEIFDKQLKLRQQIAKNAGFNNYRDYAFRRLGRFDYTPEDCAKFHEAARKRNHAHVVRELQAERRKKLGVQSLRPWDLAVDPLNRPPLKPFEEVWTKMVSRTQSIFNHLDSELVCGFQQMQNLRLLDLANRKGKAPRRLSIHARRIPRAVHFYERRRLATCDVETILHEAGHRAFTLSPRAMRTYTPTVARR